MAQFEEQTIRVWEGFLAKAKFSVIAPANGRVVKSLGDGLMVDFSSCRSAIDVAGSLHALLDRENHELEKQQRLLLRIAVHLCPIVIGENDIYGAGVNLAARLASLARPGETIISSEVRDEVIEGVDVDTEDLGECFLKHIEEPVRAYRIVDLASEARFDPVDASSEMLPTIAVVGFESRTHEHETLAVGELIADGIIANLVSARGLRVIARLSTTAVSQLPNVVIGAKKHLRADYLVHGSYLLIGQRIVLTAELSRTIDHEIVWAKRLSGNLQDLLEPNSLLCGEIAENTYATIIEGEVGRAAHQPLPTLSSFTLLLSSVSLMHRSSTREFAKSREILDHLVDRHARAADAKAWLAKWHILKVLRGISTDRKREGALAMDLTRRALDINPSSSFALAIEGYALCQLADDFAGAHDRLEKALEINPNDSLAWLFSSLLSSVSEKKLDAIEQAQRAQALSPIDPLKYFYDLLIASAYLVANRHEDALAAAQRSVRSNVHHSPTLRTLLTTQVEMDRLDEARQTLALLLREEPGLTVSGYLKSGSSASEARRRCAYALQRLGLRD
jgi:adenylate cyclase